MNSSEALWYRIKHHVSVNNIQSATNLTDNLVHEASDHLTEDNHRSCDQHGRKEGLNMWIAYKIQGGINPVIIHLNDESSSEQSTSMDSINCTEAMGIVTTSTVIGSGVFYASYLNNSLCTTAETGKAFPQQSPQETEENHKKNLS
jgi:hypothetical protein